MQRRDCEHSEAGEEHALSAGEVAEAAGEEQQAPKADEEGVHHPGEVPLAEVQIALDRGQGDVHDRDVEHDHQLRQAYDEERGPAAADGCGSRRRCERCVLHMCPKLVEGRIRG
jgi:hypothetical protein